MWDIDEIVKTENGKPSLGKKMLALAIKNGGNPSKMYKDMETNKLLLNEDVDEIVHGCELCGMGMKMVTAADEDYPECLKSLEKPPIVLFVIGDIADLDRMMGGEMEGIFAVTVGWKSFKDANGDLNEIGIDLAIGECPFLEGNKSDKKRSEWLSLELMKEKCEDNCWAEA